MSLVATIVDWNALGQTVLYAFGAGVGVVFAFSLAILGGARLTENNHDLGLVGTVGYGMLVVLGIAATAAAVVFGIIVMTS